MILYGKNELFKTLMPENDENIGALLDFAEKYALSGNLIKAKIAWLIMMDENPFSLSIERSGISGSAEVYAKRDLTELRDLFFISPKDDILGCYQPQNTRVSGEEARIGKLISDFVKKLEAAADDEAFFAEVKSFYGKYGVGDFGMNKAFYMLDDGRLVPVSHIRDISFDLIYGYDTQKQKDDYVIDAPQKIPDLGQFREAAHGIGHQRQTYEEQSETGEYTTDLLGAVLLGEECDERTDPSQCAEDQCGGYGIPERTECGDLGRDGGSDVRTVDDGCREGEGDYTGVDKTDDQNGCGSGTLDCGRGDGTYPDTQSLALGSLGEQ